MATLEISLNKIVIGEVGINEDTDTFSLVYNDTWVEDGYAISPHLPLSGEKKSVVIKRFLENLLPEGKGLDDLSAFKHIPKNNIFALIHAIGFETSGALSFTEEKKEEDKSTFRHISGEELEKRIEEIESKSIVIWDNKQRLSLAGVQEKLTVLFQEGKLGLADGNLSSTHILKFQTKRTENVVVNEYFCMTLAKEIGLTVANVELRRYGIYPVLSVERFDRVVHDTNVERLHIIDGCQMLNLAPKDKYERNYGSGRDVREIRGGASFSKLFSACNQCVVPAVAKLKLLEWAIYTLIIGNSDAHGKNISFFVNKKGIQVAPYYDMLSIIMHENVDHELAMAYGDEFEINSVLGYPLRTFANEIDLPPKLVSDQILKLCKKTKKILMNNPIEKKIFNAKENEFIDSLEKVILERSSMLEKSAKEMLKVSW